MSRFCVAVVLSTTTLTLGGASVAAQPAAESAVGWAVADRSGPLAAADTLTGGITRVTAYPGARTTGAIEVTVTDGSATIVAVAPAQVSTDQGRPRIGPADDPADPARWLTVVDTAVTATADTPATVMFVVAVPAGELPGDRLAALTVTDSTAVARTVGVIIRVPDPADLQSTGPSLTLTRATLTVRTSGVPFTGRPTTLQFTAVNTGRTVIVGDLAVGVRTLFDARIVDHSLTRTVVLRPGQSISGTADLTLGPTVRQAPFVTVDLPASPQSTRRAGVTAFGTVTDSAPTPEIVVTLAGVVLIGAAWAGARSRRTRSSPQAAPIEQ